MIYDAVFPAVERLAHFFFNVLLILWLSWMATPVILLLIPITVGVQLSRRHATTLVLDQRQRCERQYVASMSDIIENTHTFRSMPSSTIQDLFAVDTSGFGDAHLQAGEHLYLCRVVPRTVIQVSSRASSCASFDGSGGVVTTMR